MNKEVTKLFLEVRSIISNPQYGSVIEIQWQIQTALENFISDLNNQIAVLEAKFTIYERGCQRANNNRLVLEGWIDSMEPLVKEWWRLKTELARLPLVFDETIPERYKTILKDYKGR